ncbi:MAG: hypothetical protein JST00_04300 [Deltaproteobacteria bacterium]|nr:hypothetical protein [Deltaproteobacteria bacterium]
MVARRARLPGIVVVGLALLAGGPARAQDATPSAERIKTAAEEYDRGRRAYIAKEYEAAATHFENAFRDAPRAEALRNAIRARREAKQLARAATLAAIAATKYPSDAATTQLAKDVLREAAPALQQYDIECRPECAVTADGRVVSQVDGTSHRLFLDPGAHELSFGFSQDRAVTRTVEAKRGAKDALSVDAPPPKPDAPSPKPDVTPPPPVVAPVVPPPPPAEKPFGPAVFFVGAGVTVALAAGTVVSGIDTKNNPGVDKVREACAGKGESCPEYQAGKDAELRTNILLGATLGAAVVTGVIGVFFTQWSSSSSTVKVGATPLPHGGGVTAALTF